MTAFAQHWHLPVTPPPDALAMVALRALRALLRQMFEAAATRQPVTDAQLEELNAFLALSPVIRQVQRSDNNDTGVRLQIVTLHEGWTAVVSQIAASWVEVLASMPLTRLKVCANPDCHWVFIDQSHNLSRCWCRQWACGNLMKVRQFRARTRDKADR